MKRNGSQYKERRQIVKLCAHSPHEGLKVIQSRVNKLKDSKSLTSTVEILSEIFCVSERTIWNDYTE